MNWTYETRVAFIVMSILALIVLLALILAWLIAWSEGNHWIGTNWTIGTVLVCIPIAFIYWWSMYPWKAEYHSWRPVSGTVATLDDRLMPGANGGMEQKLVVTFVGDPAPYGVLDSQAAAAKPGDHLDISCVRRWQQTGTHGYDCLFVGLKAGVR